MYYITAMATITFRTDVESDQALAELATTGENKTAVIKAALLLAARARRRENLRLEALKLASDPADVAEIRSVREEMDDLRAW